MTIQRKTMKRAWLSRGGLVLAAALAAAVAAASPALAREPDGKHRGQAKSGVRKANRIAAQVGKDGRRALKRAARVPGAVEVPLPPPGSPGTPAYANFFFGFLPNDGETAGLTFFRNPDCVRPDFNLLEWVDPPAAFDCPLALDFSGRRLHESSEAPPYALEVHFKPTIYFVDLEELMSAVSDGALTIGEIQSLPSLRIGDADSADYYVVNSFAPAPVGDGDGHEWFAARGQMRDGGSFVFAYEEAHLLPEDTHVFEPAVVHFHRGDGGDCDDWPGDAR